MTMHRRVKGEVFSSNSVSIKLRPGFSEKESRESISAKKIATLSFEQGIEPDDLDYAGTEIEVEVSNKDTLRKQWEEIMEVCLKDQSGQLPGKTIVFAMTKAHAHRIAEIFERECIRSTSVLSRSLHRQPNGFEDGSYGDGLITKFRKNDRPPHRDIRGYA